MATKMTNACGQDEVVNIFLPISFNICFGALFDSRRPLRRRERGPASAAPAPNPRQGGVAQCERRPELTGGWTAPGWVELVYYFVLHGSD